MRILCACILTVFVLSGALWADPDPEMLQINTTSWPGLTGLFMIPTARIIGKQNLAFGFNEAKHVEFVLGERFSDRQIRGVMTYGVADWMEITGSYYNDLYGIPFGPDLHNTKFSTFGLKVRLLKENPTDWRPDISLAVRDLFDNTSDVGPLENVNNGRKIFLLASKKIFRKAATGRYLDMHTGVTFASNGVSGLIGFELPLAPNASLIAEGMWDSPFLNFREYGGNDVGGRFIFDPGVRIYPEMVPGMALDLGFIGDSEFEFSFGISYVASF